MRVDEAMEKTTTETQRHREKGKRILCVLLRGPLRPPRFKKLFNAEDAEEYAEGRGEEKSLCVSVSPWFASTSPRDRL
jgi:hypothetical protein